MQILKFHDIYKKGSYGLMPISNQGSKLHQKFINSRNWLRKSAFENIVEKNDNRLDVFKGAKYTYENKETNQIVEVIMSRTRSGKNIYWQFNYLFDEEVFF